MQGAASRRAAGGGAGTAGPRGQRAGTARAARGWRRRRRSGSAGAASPPQRGRTSGMRVAPAAPRLRRGLRATRSVEARQGLPSWASPVTPAAPQTHLSRECPHLGASERGTEQRGKSRSSFKVCTPRGSPGAGDRPGRPSGRRAQQAARPSTGGAARRPGRDGRGERGALGFGLEKGPDSCSWSAGSGRNPDSFEDDTSLFPSGIH